MTSVLLVDTIKNSLDSADTVAFTGGIHAPGSVIQLQSSTFGTSTSYTSSSSWVDIDNCNVVITPKFASSKIYITMSNHVYTTNHSTNEWRGALMRIMRNTTAVYADDTGGYGEGWYMDHDTQRWMTYDNRHYVDTPNTTSQITYKGQVRSKAGNTLHVNRQDYGAGGTMIAMEIAQ